MHPLVDKASNPLDDLLKGSLDCHGVALLAMTGAKKARS